jgi:acetyltransferase
MRKQLERLFQPGAIAVIGGTMRESSPAYPFLKNLLDKGFGGQIIPVNPKHRQVEGLTCYSAIAKVPVKVDLAIVATPDYAVLKVVEECGRAGVGGLIVASSPGDNLAEKEANREAISRLARRYGMRLLGPQSLGLINTNHKLNATQSRQETRKGNLAFITQSGSLGLSVLDWAVEHRIGFSYFVSLGETADVNFDDLIDYFGSDAHTSCILIYMEHLSAVRRFMSAARAFARTKPIIVLKAGRKTSNREESPYDAAFRRAGIIRVETVAQLFNCAHFLALQPRPLGNRLAVITNADGPGALAADYLHLNGGKLAALEETTLQQLREIAPSPYPVVNPVNLYGFDTPEAYAKALTICLQDPQVDGALLVLTPLFVTQPDSVAEAVVEAAQHTYKPVMASWMGEREVRKARNVLEAGKIPNYRFPESAVDAFLRMYRHHRNLQLLQEAPPATPAEFTPDKDRATRLIQAAQASNQTEIDKDTCRQLLECYHIPMIEGANTTEYYPLLLGLRKDPVFGPFIRFGLGGPGAHVYRDWRLGLPPLSIPLARRLIENTRIYPLLCGEGGGGGVNMAELEDLLCRFAYLVMDFPEIKRITINPFLLNKRNGGASSVKMELEPPGFQRGAHPYDHLVISPYPAYYRREAKLKNGGPVVLRPIRPEDEAMEIKMFELLSKETLYFRFFGYVPKLTHEFIARFTQIDYDREMAIIAELEENGEKKMIGVVRIIADAWKESAEYAIVVADPWHGQGLGSLLTDFILDIARDMGFQKITANVLATNKAMLRLFEHKGFSIKREDYEVYYAELPLAQSK